MEGGTRSSPNPYAYRSNKEEEDFLTIWRRPQRNARQRINPSRQLSSGQKDAGATEGSCSSISDALR